MKNALAPLLVSLALVAGCSSTPRTYDVSLKATVHGTKDAAPAWVLPGLYLGGTIPLGKEWAKGHTDTLGDATLFVGLLFEESGTVLPLEVKQKKNEFVCEASGTSPAGPLNGVIVKIQAPGRAPVEHTFTPTVLAKTVAWGLRGMPVDIFAVLRPRHEAK